MVASNKKLFSILLSFLFVLSLSSCLPARGKYKKLQDCPINTIWVSESPKMNVYMNGAEGDFITKEGKYQRFSLHFNVESLTISGQCISVDQEHTQLFSFGGKISNNRFIMTISADDVGKVFDATVKQIVLQRKDVEETGFLKDPKLICEQPAFYLELGEKNGRGIFFGTLTTKEKEQLFFKADIFPFYKDEAFGASLSLYNGYYSGGYFHVGTPPGLAEIFGEETGPILCGTLKMKDGKYVFCLDESYIGTVFDESVKEFELFPATEEQEKDLMYENAHVGEESAE